MNVARISSVAIIILILFFGAGLKFLRISADAPQVFPNGFESSGPVKDEAAKCYEARNKALFGEWSTSPADNYIYWRTVSPLWVYSVYAWFKVFGPGYSQIRIFSIIISLVSGLLLYLLVLRASGRAAALAALVFFSFNFYLMIFGRLGLIETMMNCFIIITVLITLSALEKPLLFPVAALSLFLSGLIKQSAFFLIPVLLMAFIIILGKYLKRKQWKSPAFWLAVLSLAAFAFALLYLYEQPEYKLRSIMNLRHALDYGQHRYGMIVRASATRKALVFAFTPSGILKGYIMMMPVAGPLAIIEIFVFAYLAVVRRGATWKELIIILWLISARAVLAFSPHLYVRFYLIQFPPACILAGILLGRVWRTRGEKTGPRDSRMQNIAAYSAILILSLALDLMPYIRWLNTPSYQIKQATEKLASAIGDTDAVIIGEWAAPLCLDTNYKSYYVKIIFNRKPIQLESFGVTHLLYSDPEVDPAVVSYRMAFPAAWEKRKCTAEIPLFDTKLHLCEVEAKLTR